MSEQVLMPMIGTGSIENKERAKNALEKARLAHEKYLIGQRNTDLQEAVEYYVDAVKYDPTIPETYYRLASLMWEQGQISVNSAIEQCKTAISLSPNNIFPSSIILFIDDSGKRYPLNGSVHGFPVTG